MPRKHRILAIDPGTKDIGIAVLEGDGLIYHGVHCVADRTSAETILKDVREMFVRLVRDFAPRLVVVEKTFLSKSSNIALLNVVGDELVRLAKRFHLPVRRYAPSTVRKALCGNGRASKEDVAKTIVGKYPKLAVYLTQERKWKARFHFNRFDAIALGLVEVAL